MDSADKGLVGVGTVLILIALIATVGLQFAWYYPSEEHVNVTVKEKWIKYNGDTAYYLFSDTNGNVYKMSDDWWYLKFNSSDQYQLIQPGMKVNMVTCGWRTNWLSEYPNVISINEA
jgi:hypothetical protein